MTLTLLIERIIAEPTSLWTSLVHPEKISEWVRSTWTAPVRIPLSKHSKDLVHHEVLRDITGTWASSRGPPAPLSSRFFEESTLRLDRLRIRTVAVAYSVSGITLSGPTSVCPGLPKTKVRVFLLGDEERLTDKVKPPPLGLWPGNTSRSWAGNSLSTNQEWSPTSSYPLNRQSRHRHPVLCFAKLWDRLEGFPPAKFTTDFINWFPSVFVISGLTISTNVPLHDAQ